jgi:hypothetical protein
MTAANHRLFRIALVLAMGAAAPAAMAQVQVSWTPLWVVKSRATSPYGFSVTVSNGTAVSIRNVAVVNANASWTGLTHGVVTNSGGSTLAYASGDNTGTLRYTGAVPQNGSSTLAFSFASVPTETATRAYTFRVNVTSSTTRTFDFTVSNTVPLPDVANLSLLSTAAGQVLYWTNTSNANGTHDGVVILRAASPGALGRPVDGHDYTGETIYFDRGGSNSQSAPDNSPGTWYYRVCNHDVNLVYSNCDSGFWNNAGYIDSVALPVGVSWAHTLGWPVLGYPGVWQGRVAVASNAPSLAVFSASDGQRPFAPTTLAHLPAIGTPAAPVNGGASSLVFGADSSGGVVAVDLANGLRPPGWSVTKNQSFVGGIAGILEQYVEPAYQGNYTTDVLLLGSSSAGRLLAVNARTGVNLWGKARLTNGATIVTQPHYDYATNQLFVAYDNGGGIVAYGGLRTGVAPNAALWSRPGTSYVTPCTFGSGANQIACIDDNGVLHVLTTSNGADLVGGTGYATGVTDASSLWLVSDGYVVSNASTIKRIVVSGSNASVTGTYSPGLTLSPVLVAEDVGFVYVAASDLKLHKLRLSDLVDTGVSRAVTPAGTSPILGAPAFDVANDLFLFGSSDGRLWAVPVF